MGAVREWKEQKKQWDFELDNQRQGLNMILGTMVRLAKGESAYVLHCWQTQMREELQKENSENSALVDELEAKLSTFDNQADEQSYHVVFAKIISARTLAAT